MAWIIWGVILPSCAASAAWIARRPIQMVVDELNVDTARAQFRHNREWLEARFLTALGRFDPIERLRWDEARWLDQVHWARDAQTRLLLALVEVRFDAGGGSDHDGDGDNEAPGGGHATALFEYRKGAWIADGKRLDATRPLEAFRRHARFRPVAAPAPPRRASS